jgi:hypothetical protein
LWSAMTLAGASSATNCFHGKDRLSIPRSLAIRGRIPADKTMKNHYQFRLNGLIIMHLKVRPVVIGGTADYCELVACHDIGEFAIDDNEELADPALTRFILEVRDVTIPPIERRNLPDKGWKRVTTSECLALLESAGIIDRS